MNNFKTKFRVIKSIAEKLGYTVEDQFDGVHSCAVFDKDNQIVSAGGYPIVYADMKNIINNQAQKDKLARFQNRVDAVNLVHGKLKQVQKELIAYISENDVKFKQDGTLQKRSKDALNSIVDSVNNNEIKHYFGLSINRSFISVKASVWVNPAYESDHGYYYDNWVNVWNFEKNEPETRGQFLNTLTIEQLIDADQNLPVIEQKIKELESSRSIYKGLLGL